MPTTTQTVQQYERLTDEQGESLIWLQDGAGLYDHPP
jgi:hypothetical protein